jgi:hypothetical protein
MRRDIGMENRRQHSTDWRVARIATRQHDLQPVSIDKEELLATLL